MISLSELLPKTPYCPFCRSFVPWVTSLEGDDICLDCWNLAYVIYWMEGGLEQ